MININRYLAGHYRRIIAERPTERPVKVTDGTRLGDHASPLHGICRRLQTATGALQKMSKF
ncbi:MAG: hypothetical protein AB2813_12525 [Candidatus Sedimenticola endophacoides]